MKTKHKRCAGVFLRPRICFGCLLLGIFLLLLNSPLSAQTSQPALIQARGVLESSNVEHLQAQVLDGTRIVSVIPHGARVTKGTPLLEFEHRQSPVEKARRQLLKAELELRSSLKEIEVLEDFTKERKIAELRALSEDAEKEYERTKAISEIQIQMQRAKIHSVQEDFATVEDKYHQLMQQHREGKGDDSQLEKYEIRSRKLKEAVLYHQAAFEELKIKSDRKMAKTEFEKSIAKLDIIQYQEGDYIAQKEALEAQIEAARENIERGREHYESIKRAVHQTQLLAPTDGIVFHHDPHIPDGKPFAVEPGARVQQGQVLLKFARLASKQVRVPICESDILRLEEGQSANVRFTALPTQEFSAMVTSISELPRIEKPTSDECVNYDVILDVADLPAELKLGMTCEVKFSSD